MTVPPLRQWSGSIEVATRGKGLVDITAPVSHWLGSQGIEEGLATLFCRHTSASLLVQENAALAVRRDIADWFERIAPETADYEHDDEGPDDMPAHLRSAITATSLQIPVLGGRMRLGTWQAVYLFEHRRRAHRREIAIHLIGA